MRLVQIDFEGIAKRLHNRARSGEHCGDLSARELAYIQRCSVKVADTTVLFTHDRGQHEFGWLKDPAHDRCWHLSLSAGDPDVRDGLLRAFFGDQLERVWGQSHVFQHGHVRKVLWHWRLFCDDRWVPRNVENEGDLLAAGMQRARDLGIVVRPTHLAA